MGLHHGVVHAGDRDEVIRSVFEIVGAVEAVETMVNGEPVPVDEVLNGV